MMTIPSSKNLGSPVFITSLALSPRNAIGVQVSNFARLWRQPWRHCYWDTGTGLSTARNSILLKSSIPERWPLAAGRGFLARQLEKMNLCWWKGDRLQEKRKSTLAARLASSTVAYVAPLSPRDALRSLEVLRVLRIPYVVHLWDVIGGNGLNAASPGYPELLSSAEHIFCVSSAIEEDARKISTQPVSLLSFTRPDANVQAAPFHGRGLRIAISGHLAPYQHGLDLLVSALPALQQAFASVSVLYIGAHDQAAMLPEPLRNIATQTGFVDDAARDRLLSECSVAYLPGPLLDTTDMRSRYSIPSRMADYFSIGLPVVAAVHEGSATNRQFGAVSGNAFQRIASPSQLLSALAAMEDEKFWSQASRGARSCFLETMSEEVVLGHLESVIAGLFDKVKG